MHILQQLEIVHEQVLVHHPKISKMIKTKFHENSITKYFWINSEPTTRKNVADVWLATALANKVFPEIIKYEKQCFRKEFL